MPEKKGLYYNIQQKRKRIAGGSGEKMRKVGAKGAPTAKNFKDSAKTAKKMYGGGMVQTGTPDKDKIMGAASKQQNPQQRLMQMNRNKVTGMNKGGKPKVNPGMDALGKSNPKIANKILDRKVYAMGGGVRKVRY